MHPVPVCLSGNFHNSALTCTGQLTADLDAANCKSRLLGATVLVRTPQKL